LIGFLLFDVSRRNPPVEDIPRMHHASRHTVNVQPDRGCQAVTGKPDRSGCLLSKKTYRSSDPNLVRKSNWPTLPRVCLMAFLLDGLRSGNILPADSRVEFGGGASLPSVSSGRKSSLQDRCYQRRIIIPYTDRRDLPDHCQQSPH
jgi:hypothetical protein